MNIQERYDEMYQIVDTLENLIDEVSDEDYKDRLRDVMYDAIREKEELEQRLILEEEQEEKALELEYENSVL